MGGRMMGRQNDGKAEWGVHSESCLRTSEGMRSGNANGMHRPKEYVGRECWKNRALPLKSVETACYNWSANCQMSSP